MAEPRIGGAVGLLLAAVFTFAVADVVTKYLTERYPVPFVLFIRYAINLILLIAMLAPRHGRAMLHTRRTGLVLLRGASLSAVSVAMGLALRHMPVGETVAIVHLAPLAVVVFAGPLLGEMVRIGAWIAVGLAFAGVLLIVRPGGGLSAAGTVFALLCAAFTVIYQMFSRLLAATETAAALLSWTAMIGVIAFGLALPFFLPATSPDLPGWIALVGLGILATLGHALFTAAYRRAPASILSPFNYAHLVWAAALGWVAFGHLPDVLAASGIAMVVLGGVVGATTSARKPALLRK